MAIILAKTMQGQRKFAEEIPHAEGEGVYSLWYRWYQQIWLWKPSR